MCVCVNYLWPTFGTLTLLEPWTGSAGGYRRQILSRLRPHACPTRCMLKTCILNPALTLSPNAPHAPLILSAARRYQRHLLWMQRWSSHPQNSATSRYTTAVVIDNTAACATPTPPQRLTRNAGVRTKQCA